jgi:hypothetical protein
VATAATASLFWFVIYRTKDLLSTGFCAFALLMPAITTNIVADAPLWAFAAMVAWALYLVARYVENEYSVYLFQAGLLITIAFYIDVRVGIGALVLGAELFALYAVRETARAICVTLVLVFPVAYFALTSAYVQWVFTGHPWVPLPPVGPRPIWHAYPVVLAYFIALASVAAVPRASRRRYHVAIFLTLPIVSLTGQLFGRRAAAGEVALLAMAGALAAITQIGNVWLRRISSLALLCGAGALALTMPPIPSQHILFNAPAPPAFVPSPGHPEWELYVNVARWLVALIMAAGVILLARHSLRRLTGRTA